MARSRRLLRCCPALLLGAVACGAPALGGLSSPPAPRQNRPESAAVRRTWPAEGGAFERWLRQTFVPGRTTQDEVIGIFGRGYIDLDRPVRDGVISFEYDLRKLGVRGLGWYLVFDFTPGRRLLRWYDPMHLGICGFCPHVFADDGRWRLEGKALAGCVGAGREGTDAAAAAPGGAGRPPARPAGQPGAGGRVPRPRRARLCRPRARRRTGHRPHGPALRLGTDARSVPTVAR